MITSESEKIQIKFWEELHLTAYDKGHGELVIGYGHTNKSETANIYPVYPGMVITEEKAEEIFNADLLAIESKVNDILDILITQNMFDAIIDFAFGLGVNVLKTSKLLAYINAKIYSAAQEDFMNDLYRTTDGIIDYKKNARRREEQVIFGDGMPDDGNEIEYVEDPHITRMITWMLQKQGKVTYSMDNRLGPDSYDCSSAVYFSLVYGGLLKEGSMGNTDTLFNDLERNGWEQVPNNQQKLRGDIFIWGFRVASTGAYGHTGIFIDNGDLIIHCNYGNNGITTNSYSTYWNYDGQPHQTIYRYTGTNNPVPKPDGNLISKNGTFIPDRTLSISGDTTVNSPALGYYDAGEKINYDSYTFSEGYAWISYLAASGPRRYVAVGPDDGRNDTSWGTGFFDENGDGSYGSLTPKKGTFIPDRTLSISGDTTVDSPALGYYDAGEKIYYDYYTFNEGYAWISYQSYSGYRRYVAVGPDDGRTDTSWGTGFFDDGNNNISNGDMIPLNGIFYPDRTLSISSDTTVDSPAIGYYDPGEAIRYDSYTFNEGYAWISYVSYSGERRYVAVGPDDGRTDTSWGTGFFDDGNNNGSDQNGPHGNQLIPKYGTFIPDRTLSISGDATVASPPLGSYDAGEKINYDCYLFNEGYAWISYVSYSGERRYIAVGPDDGNTNNTWGTGFFN